MSVSTVVGQVLLRRLDSTSAVYASEPQFVVLKDEVAGAWVIKHCPAARNPTFYEGEQLTEAAQPLAEGGVVSIGTDRLKLRVAFDKE